MARRLFNRAALRGAAAAGGALALGACALMPDGESVCPDRGPNTGSWPYCGEAPPGGPGAADDRVNPRGGPSRG
ncbi:hypothetical protein F1654_09530 [Alkalicaulis satelles]|uniref:Lipoprotein n=1 Tax=Alkalicaulis satelles TaxID=2609175 RepID=A0A5M6ZJV6_9PROT|nr:hypothetical protein [Alkalicaulis satelles]KAA5804014.1 hypothetical protein F1654_09530 [Alkalicaulis satelles]